MLIKELSDIEKKEEIFKDKEDLRYHLKTVLQRPDYVRAVKKAPSFPFNYTTHYKTKRGNRYIIILTPTDKKSGGLENPLFSVYTKMETGEGVYMLRYDLVKNHVMIYTPHFFSRYRSRFLKDSTIPTDKLIDIFAKRNFNITFDLAEGMEHIGTCKDGYIHLKAKDKGLTIAVTFVSFDMLRPEQTTETGRLLEFLKKWEEKLGDTSFIG